MNTHARRKLSPELSVLDVRPRIEPGGAGGGRESLRRRVGSWALSEVLERASDPVVIGARPVLSAGAIIELQRIVGNRAVADLIRRGRPGGPGRARFTAQRTIADYVSDYTARAVQLRERTPEPTARQFVTELANWLSEEMWERDRVHKWKLKLSDASGETYGRFSAYDWTLTLSVRPIASFLDRQHRSEAFGEYVDTILHEAYHCEQYFTMARVLASQGIKAGDINQYLKMPFTARDAALTSMSKRQVDKGEEARAAVWKPWFTDSHVKTWLAAVKRIKDKCLRILKARGELVGTDVVERMLQSKRWKSIETASAGGLTEDADVSARIADLTALLVKQRDDVAAGLAGVVGEGGDKSAKLRQLTGDDGPVCALYETAYDIYRKEDPTEASAWELGGLAASKFKEALQGGLQPAGHAAGSSVMESKST